MPDNGNLRIQLAWALQETLPLLLRVKYQITTKQFLDRNLCEMLALELAKLPAAMLKAQSADDHQLNSPNISADGLRLDHQAIAARAPDYDHWARLSEWTVEQAVVLVADLDPENFQEIIEPGGSRLYEWMQSALTSGQLERPISPSSFLRWFDLMGSDHAVVPPKLRQAIVRHKMLGSCGRGAENREIRPQSRADVVTGDQATSEPPKDGQLGKKARNTLQILLAHFVRASEAVVLDEGKNPVSWSMAVKIAESLIPPRDPKTVQNHLNAALKTADQMTREKSARQPFRK